MGEDYNMYIRKKAINEKVKLIKKSEPMVAEEFIDAIMEIEMNSMRWRELLEALAINPQHYQKHYITGVETDRCLLYLREADVNFMTPHLRNLFRVFDPTDVLFVGEYIETKEQTEIQEIKDDSYNAYFIYSRIIQCIEDNIENIIKNSIPKHGIKIK